MINEKEVIAQPKKHNVIETTAQSVKQVRCQQGGYRRRLFDVTEEGIYVWCKECRRPHVVSWEKLAALREELRRTRLMSIHSIQVS